MWLWILFKRKCQYATSTSPIAGCMTIVGLLYTRKPRGNWPVDVPVAQFFLFVCRSTLNFDIEHFFKKIFLVQWVIYHRALDF